MDAPFKLPLQGAVGEIQHKIYDADGCYVGETTSIVRRDYIIAAVNQHESLVRERDELRKHFESSLEDLKLALFDAEGLRRERYNWEETAQLYAQNAEAHQQERDTLRAQVEALREHLRLHCGGTCGYDTALRASEGNE